MRPSSEPSRICTAAPRGSLRLRSCSIFSKSREIAVDDGAEGLVCLVAPLHAVDDRLALAGIQAPLLQHVGFSPLQPLPNLHDAALIDAGRDVGHGEVHAPAPRAARRARRPSARKAAQPGAAHRIRPCRRRARRPRRRGPEDRPATTDCGAPEAGSPGTAAVAAVERGGNSACAGRGDGLRFGPSGLFRRRRLSIVIECGAPLLGLERLLLRLRGRRNIPLAPDRFDLLFRRGDGAGIGVAVCQIGQRVERRELILQGAAHRRRALLGRFRQDLRVTLQLVLRRFEVDRGAARGVADDAGRVRELRRQRRKLRSRPDRRAT